jgi:hypothetical protein
MATALGFFGMVSILEVWVQAGIAQGYSSAGRKSRLPLYGGLPEIDWAEIDRRGALRQTWKA